MAENKGAITVRTRKFMTNRLLNRYLALADLFLFLVSEGRSVGRSVCLSVYPSICLGRSIYTYAYCFLSGNKWSSTFCIRVGRLFPRPRSAISWPRCTRRRPTSSSPSGSTRFSAEAKPSASLSSTTTWTGWERESAAIFFRVLMFSASLRFVRWSVGALSALNPVYAFAGQAGLAVSALNASLFLPR